MIHKMNLQNGPYNSIKNGDKDIELRLYDEKRRKINVGDIIEFNNDENTDILRKQVVKLHLFENFDELYKNFDKKRLGYSKDDVAVPTDMSKYYREEDIKKYGVVGIELKGIDSSVDIGIDNNYGTFKLRVAGIIISNNKILLAKAKKFNGFVFPGGHVEIGELSSDAIKREIKEELKLEFNVDGLFCVHENLYKLKDNRLANEVCYYYKISLCSDSNYKDFVIEENDKGVMKKHEYSWIDLDELTDKNINPKDLVSLIKKDANSFNNIITSKE